MGLEGSRDCWEELLLEFGSKNSFWLWNISVLMFNNFTRVYLQERIPINEVFEQLKCTREGLSNEEGQKRLVIFGPNKLEEKKAFTSLF